MRSDGVVVLHVTHEDVAQVLLADHNNMVEAFPADRTDQASAIKTMQQQGHSKIAVPNEHPNNQPCTRPVVYLK
jgi:hypothetical protein